MHTTAPAHPHATDAVVYAALLESAVNYNVNLPPHTRGYIPFGVARDGGLGSRTMLEEFFEGEAW